MRRVKVMIFSILFLVSGFFWPQWVLAQSASVGLDPASGSFAKDATFDVEVKINVSEAVTAAKIYIGFDNQKITGQSIDTSGSALTTAWPEAVFDNSSGVVKLQAAQSIPGVSGEVAVANLRFIGVGAGETTLALSSSSLLLTSDDRNLLTSFGNLGTFTITAPAQPSAGNGSSSSGDGGTGGTSAVCAKRGDVDCNGRVDLVDLSRLLANWRKNFAAADFNKNGVVDIVDLSILLANWRK